MPLAGVSPARTGGGGIPVVCRRRDTAAPIPDVMLPSGTRGFAIDARRLPVGSSGARLSRGVGPVQPSPGPGKGVPRPVNGVQTAIDVVIDGHARLAFAANDLLFPGIEERLPLIRTRLPDLRNPVPFIGHPLPLVSDLGPRVRRVYPSTPAIQSLVRNLRHQVAIDLPPTPTRRHSGTISTLRNQTNHQRTPTRVSTVPRVGPSPAA
jgi:hypothetical protein